MLHAILAVVLLAPPLAVDVRLPETAPGLYFAGLHREGGLNGNAIFDEQGRQIWYQPIPAGEMVTDLRVQTYQGRPVLTWWQTTRAADNTRGQGVIADTSYRTIKIVKPSDGHELDLHEFKLTSRGTALVLSYPRVRKLPGDRPTLDGVVEELDVATGRTLFRWSALDHLPVTDTYAAPATAPGKSHDPFHLNSVDLTADGNFLVSARNTSAIYKIDRATGRILWRLGGRRSDFALAPDARFSFQHDAREPGPDTIALFDNANELPGTSAVSGAKWLKLDPAAKTATLVRSLTHPDRRAVYRSGNAQALPGGNTLVSWGQTGRISEFSPAGKVLLEAKLPDDTETYRVFKSPWSARPAVPPSAEVVKGVLHARWNGATGVTSWRVSSGNTLLKIVPWAGWDTEIALPNVPKDVRVEAVSSVGAVLGASVTSAPR